ncbi:hypothetical protein HZB03_02805, partial [Candidatus Woesearchaeota archaeon]|nr:hypothetical protein [Candidatus Woesearchaeota archaeon]
MKDVKLLTQKVIDLLDELERYQYYKEQFLLAVNNLFREYQRRHYTYFQYEQELKKILKEKTREEWIEYYNAYLYSLLKRIEAYNDQIFYEIYQDKRFEEIGKKEAPVMEKMAARVEVIPHIKKKVVLPPRKAEPKKEAVIEPIPGLPKGPAVPPVAEISLEKPALSLLSFVAQIRLFFQRLFARREIEREVARVKGVPEKPARGLAPKVKPAKVTASLMDLVRKPKEALLGAPPAAKAAPGEVGFGAGFGWQFIQALRGRRKETAFTETKVEFGTSTVRLETLRRKAAPELQAQVEEITATALTEEARRIKSILEKRKALKIYQPSFFGALANVTIKKMSLWLLDNFPDFFKELYQTLRLANIKILSNTYVNMMVLGIISAFIFGLFLFGIVFSFLDLSFKVIF